MHETATKQKMLMACADEKAIQKKNCVVHLKTKNKHWNKKQQQQHMSGKNQAAHK